MNTRSIPTINHFSALVENVLLTSESDIETCDLLTRELGVNVVDRYIYNFKPQGRTIIYVLTESHLAIHTWPEHNLLHIDLVTCSKMTQHHFELAILSSFKDIPNTKITITKC